jgi:hypothetical protein
MTQARSGHTAFLLDNGKVLVVAGGVNVGDDTLGLASAELFDPASGTWTPTGSLNDARMNQAGARLVDGRVLVAGGQDRGVTFANFNSAEVYDPASGTWTLTTNPMITARRGGFSLTTLSSGQVLVASGWTDWTSISTANAELFDPTTGVWTPTTPLPTALNNSSATLLADGQVLVAGGWNGATSVPSAEVFGVPNSPPVAQAGGPYSVPEGGSVQLDASGTTDADLPEDMLTYAWDFDGDGPYDDAVGSTPFFSAPAFDGPTTVSVGLRVMDAARTSSTGTATIAVTNAMPAASISGPDDGLVAKPYSFAFSATDPSPADTAAGFDYAIHWGDGNSTSVTDALGIVVRNHFYKDFGSYNITVTATDKDGGTDIEVTDQWVGTDDATDGGGTPAIVHYIHGPRGLVPTSVIRAGDNIEWTYNLTVPAGQTVRLTHFTILGNTRAAAAAAANALVTATGFGGQAAAFLSQGELDSTQNFVFDRPPMADAGGPYGVGEGGSVLLDTSGTGDPDLPNDDLTYAWDFDLDGQYDDATGVQPTFSAAWLDGPGSVTVGLQVTDSGGLISTDTATVSVTDVPPVAFDDDYSVAEDDG